jgi:hypothetical protein
MQDLDFKKKCVTKIMQKSQKMAKNGLILGSNQNFDLILTQKCIYLWPSKSFS